jgi:hypothetical protein
MSTTLLETGSLTAPPALATLNPPAAIPQSDYNPLAAELLTPARDITKALANREKWDTLAEKAAITPDAFFAEYPYQPIPGEDTTARRQRLINRVFLRSRLDGREIPGGDLGYDATRARIANSLFEGRGADDDGAFHGEVLKHVQTVKDRREVSSLVADEASAAALAAVVDPTSRAGAWKATREKLALMPGYDPTNEADQVDTFRAVEMEARAKLAPFADELAQVWEAMNRGGAGTTSEVLKKAAGALLPDTGDPSAPFKAVADEFEKRDAAATAFQIYKSIPEDDRQDFMDALGLLARRLPDATRNGFFANMAKQGGRSVDSSGRGAAESAMMIGLSGGMADPIGMGLPGQMVDPEQTAAMRAEYMAARNFAADVRRIEQQDFSPMKSAWSSGAPGKFESGLYGIPGVLASTVQAALPGVGLPLTFLSMHGQAYDQLRNQLRASGVSDKDASKFADVWSPVVAVPQMVLEKLQAGALVGKLPGVQTAMTAAGDLIKNRALRFASRTAIAGVYETGVETAQDALTYTAQSIGSALQKEIPGVNWGGVMAGAWTNSLETFVAMIPLAMIGAAHGHFDDKQLVSVRGASDTELKAIGYSADAIEKIRGAAGFSSLRTELEAANATRDPNSPEAKAAVAEIEAIIRAQIAAGLNLKASLVLPDVVVSKDGFQVVDPETREVIGTAKDEAGAMKIASAHSAALDDAAADEVAYLLSTVQAAKAAVELDPQSEMTVRLEKTMTEAAVAAEFPQALARFYEERRMRELAEGGTGEIAGVVLGVSISDFNSRVRETANQIYRGGSVLTVFHETGHGLRRAAHAAGLLTREDDLALIRAVDAVMAGKLMRHGERAGQSLRFIPEGVADIDVSETMIDEAISEILEMEVMRTRAGGTKRPEGHGIPSRVNRVAPGIISRNLTALGRMDAQGRIAEGATIGKIIGKWKAFSDAIRGMFGLATQRALALRKAEREGLFDSDSYDAYLDRLTNTSAMRAHENAAAGVAQEILGEVDAPFSLGRLDRPLFTSRNVAALRHDKEEWLKAGATPAGAMDVVRKYYRPAVMAGIPREAVLVPVPSTSGRNILPAMLAARIAQDLGNTVETRELGVALAKGEAKNKRTFFDKLSDPVKFQPNEANLAALKAMGRPVAITEDVHNTGESWIAFARMLQAHGLEVVAVATLASTEQRMTSPRDIERMAEKISSATGKPLADVVSTLQPLFAGSYKQLANKAETDVTRQPEKSTELLAIASEHAGNFANPLKDRDQGAGGGSGLYEKTGRQSDGLTQGTFGFSLGNAENHLRAWKRNNSLPGFMPLPPAVLGSPQAGRQAVKYPALEVGTDPVYYPNSRTGLIFPNGHEIQTDREAPDEVPAGGREIWDRISENGISSALSHQTGDGADADETAWLTDELAAMPGADKPMGVADAWRWIADALNSDALAGHDPVEVMDALAAVLDLPQPVTGFSADPLTWMEIAPGGALLVATSAGEYGFGALPTAVQLAAAKLAAVPDVAFSLGLSAVHNLTAENLAFADRMGGLAVPSIAVLPAGNVIEGFGEITLIGGRRLADPRENPVFDADAYTARFPSPEWKKVPVKVAQAVVNRFRPFAAKGLDRGWNLIDSIWDNSVNKPDPEKAISQLKRIPSAKAAFLSLVHGVEIEPIQMAARVNVVGVDHPIFREWIAKTDGQMPNYNDQEARREMARALNAAALASMEEMYAKLDPDKRKIILDKEREDRANELEDGMLPFNFEHRISRAIDKLDTTELDQDATNAAIDEALDGREAEFYQWIEDQIRGMFEPPRLKVAGKYAPYTLSNIVRVMTSGKIAGKENTMTFSEGKIRALNAHRFSDLEEMREDAGQTIKTEKEVAALKSELSDRLTKWREALIPHYKYPSTWSALDDAMAALDKFMRGPQTAARMASSLRAMEFERVPDRLVQEAVEIAAGFMAAPVPYFESKPQRVVELSEFHAAIVPENASAETLEILERNGIAVVPVSAESRRDAPERVEAMQQAIAADPRVSFALAGRRAVLPSMMRNSLEAAKAMAAEGKPAETIRALTGWVPGKYDGKMRWEIPDNGMVIRGMGTAEELVARWWPHTKERNPKAFSIELRDILRHPKLYQAYPDAQSIPVIADPSLDSNGALNVQGYGGSGPVILVHAALKGAELKSTLIHEIQHWIQERENFARGSSPEMMRQEYARTRARLAGVESSEEYKQAIAEQDAIFARFNDQGQTYEENEKDLAAHVEANPALKESNRLAAELSRLSHGEVSFDEVTAYRRSAGEIEARDVQARAGYTAAQLAAIEPYASQNIEPAAAIVMGSPFVSFSIGRALELAKVAEKKSNEAGKAFFKTFWPRMMKLAGQSLAPSARNINEASRRAVADILDWVKNNPVYQTYYTDDWKLAREILGEAFPDFSEDEFLAFRLFSGICSPNTNLKGNLADAVQVIKLWRETGSFKSLTLTNSPETGNRIAGPGPFALQSNTGATKIFSLHALESVRSQFGTWKETIAFLQEPVTSAELNAFKRSLGYAGGVGSIGAVRRVVQEATGQSEMIPRMMAFGQKVGAYTLNSIGDSRYTTTDVWESRFIRSYFPDMFKTADGLPSNDSEHSIFQRFATAFNREFERQHGEKLDNSALQAVRWFYMLDQARAAGYRNARTNDTISGYTLAALQNYLGFNPQGGGRGSAGSDRTKRSTGQSAGEGQGSNVAFALAPSAMVSRLNERTIDLIRNPRERAAAYQRLSRKLISLRLTYERLELVAGSKRRKSSLRKEAAVREALRADELTNEVWGRHGAILSDDDLTRLKAQPVHALLADPNSKLRGRLMSKGRALQQQADMFITSRGGEWDGSDGISRAVFGGSLLPDQAAQELYDNHLISSPTPDAMWDAIRREQSFVDNMKEALRKATDELRDAKKQAKEETNAWLKSQGSTQAAAFSDKAEILRALAVLDGILAIVPAAIRGKIGGYSQLASLGSNETRLEFLKTRLAKVDTEMEKWLAAQYDREFRELLKRTRPAKEKPGEKPTGSIGADLHEVFRAVEASMTWTPPEVEAEAAKLESLAASGSLTAEEEANATTQANLIRLAGTWTPKYQAVLDANGDPTGESVMAYPGADAARREQAVIEAARIIESGYWTNRLEASRKRAERRAMQDRMGAATGKAGTREERRQKAAEEAGVKGGKGWLPTIYDLMSFEQVLNFVFGEDSDDARRFADRERWSSDKKTDSIDGQTDALAALYIELAGGGLEGSKLAWRMAQSSLTIRGETFSEMEAIQATLMWRQEDGRRHMLGHQDDDGNYVGKWHYDQAFVDEIEAALSPEAKEVRLFLIERYAAEYDRLNPVYRELYGVNLPRNKFYSPLTVKPIETRAGAENDPVTGSPAGLAFTPGSLKNRSSDAIAEPDFRDAAQTWIAHVKQIEHWIAYAPLVKDLQAVIGNRDVRNSIEAAAGKESVHVLGKWVEYFGLGGTRDASAHLALNGKLGKLTSRAAGVALVGRVGVLAVQSVQLGAALAEMPTGAYLKRLGQLFAGQLGWGDALKSEYIRRRMDQLPPAVRMALDGLYASSPNALKHAMAKVGTLIGAADAFFTAGTYAITLDYHRAQLAKSGLAGAELETAAHQAAQRSCDRVAQPVRPGARSFYEVSATHPMARLGWAFASEARQKLGLVLYAGANKNVDWGRKGRAVAVAWLIGGAITTLIRTAWRDARDDDDEEIFDKKNWSAGRLTFATLTGPLKGLPVLGDSLEATAAAMAGEYSQEGNLLTMIPNAAKAAKRLVVDGPDDWQEAMTDAERLLMGLGVFSDSAAAAAQFSHLVRDSFSLLDNVQ